MRKNDIHHYHGRVNTLYKRAIETTCLLGSGAYDRVGGIVRQRRDYFAMNVFITEAIALSDELDRQYPIQQALDWSDEALAEWDAHEGRAVPDVEDGGQIELYPYGSMKVPPSNA